MSLHRFLQLRLCGACGQIEHGIEGKELEKVAVLRWLVLRGRARASIAGFPSPICSGNADALTFCYIRNCRWDIKKYPMVKYSCRPERLRHVRVVHDESERLGLRGNATHRKWRTLRRDARAGTCLP